MDRPLIGITTYWVRAEELGPARRWGRPEQPMVMSTADYARCVAAVGGVPVLLPLVEEPAIPDLYVARCDGLLFAGGADLDPHTYGGDRSRVARFLPERDAFELALLRAALERSVPVLGICRGLQLINVALGGTLHHDLREAGVTPHPHFTPCLPMTEPTHRVHLAEGSALRAAYGCGEVWVNSFHHQGVEALGSGLQPVGRGDDGTVEAVEHPAYPLVCGVQWHPEMMAAAHPGQLAPFRLLVETAAAPGRRPPPRRTP
ncbi:MAG: gamma-glutamyl-gamma-aminobutyrate hydrolase family protein [Deferrisomatales bacterium]